MTLIVNKQLMILLLLSFWAALAGCGSGIRTVDFESKQFTATYKADSPHDVDTTSLSDLLDSKAIYRFGKDGKGINHIQIGMSSKDTPFTWAINGDSLRINSTPYAVQKQDEGFILKSDSTRIMLNQQP